MIKLAIDRVIYGDGRISYELYEIIPDCSSYTIGYPRYKATVLATRPCLKMIEHELKIIERKRLSRKILSRSTLSGYVK